MYSDTQLMKSSKSGMKNSMQNAALAETSAIIVLEHLSWHLDAERSKSKMKTRSQLYDRDAALSSGIIRSPSLHSFETIGPVKKDT